MNMLHKKLHAESSSCRSLACRKLFIPVKTPPTIAQTPVRKCINDLRHISESGSQFVKNGNDYYEIILVITVAFKILKEMRPS